jgi:hypothetical protein
MLKRVKRRRRVRRELATLTQGLGTFEDHSFEIVVHFPDTPVNLYQLRQWYEPLRLLAERHPLAVVTRSPSSTLRIIEECPLPVVYLRTIGEVEAFLDTQDITMVLYVNNSMRNFQMLRFASPLHVFVNHGESEKSCMTSNQLRAYNFCFVAGDAAIQRISEKLVDFDTERRLIPIGRPQVDVVAEAPDLPADGRQVVLYAPTWEGDRPSMRYGSVVSHGREVVQTLVGTGRHRVIFRPHPRTGTVDREFGEALREISELLRSANIADPQAQHVIDVGTGESFGWQLQAADVCVCDISSVAFDWLATGKPLLLTRPASEEAEVDWSGLAGALPTVAAEDTGAVLSLIEDAQRGAGREEHTRLVHHYFGDTSPGSCMERFLAACEYVIQARDQIRSGHPLPPHPGQQGSASTRTEQRPGEQRPGEQRSGEQRSGQAVEVGPAGVQV